MNEQERKARKQYKCDMCNGIIKKGEIYSHYTGKAPREDKDGVQIGIEYYNHRTHAWNCLGRLHGLTVEEAKNLLQKCDKGHHEYEEHYERDGYVGYWPVGAPTGDFYCVNCGEPK